MGELLFWVGEDKMTFGSDYGIWEPKWQIEGFVDWDYPDDESRDYPRVNTATKKKILGLNAAKLYDIEVPKELQLAEAGARDDATLVESGRATELARRRRGLAEGDRRDAAARSGPQAAHGLSDDVARKRRTTEVRRRGSA